MNEQNINNGQYNNPQTMQQQPINNQMSINNAPKKKNTALIIGLSIVGLFVLGIVSLFIVYAIEEKQDKPWKSGQVEILGKNIQLPMDVEEFEKTLNTKIIDGEYSEKIKDVKIKLDYNSVLTFDVYVENDKVTGIMLDAYRTGETERDTDLKVVFPGNVTIASSIDKVKELYKTKPFNSSYVYWDEEIGDGVYTKKFISAGHQYQNDDWSIQIKTTDDEITGIDYYYLGD